jgi:hypothetical protein
MFGKKKGQPVNFILFKTACNCTRMEMTTPRWEPSPYIDIPLLFPLAIKDWVQEVVTYDMLSPRKGTRRFRLQQEDILQDQVTKIYTYEEIEG